MKIAKEKISNYEEKIVKLMKENQSLKVEGALTFNNLTPRPSFEKVSELIK